MNLKNRIEQNWQTFNLEFEDLCEIKYEFRLSTTEVVALF
jgi:hypothetical protein